MDQNKTIIEDQECDELSWKKYAIKQGYLIKIQRGLLKEPKMQYFVLTECGLISFESEPCHDTEPLCFLPYEQLSSIKLVQIELNGCELSCMQLTSKTTPSFVLAFNRKKDRDDWMMVMMRAFSQALLTMPLFNKASDTIDIDKAFVSDDDSATKEKIVFNTSVETKEKAERKFSTSSIGRSLRRKRRKGDKGSIRRTKSYESLALNRVTNVAMSLPKAFTNPLPTEESHVSLPQTRKRKSEPDVHIVSQLPNAWTTDKLFENSCGLENRDLLTVQSDKQMKNKGEGKYKTNMLSKLVSKVEYTSQILCAQ